MQYAGNIYLVRDVSVVTVLLGWILYDKDGLTIYLPLLVEIYMRKHNAKFGRSVISLQRYSGDNRNCLALVHPSHCGIFWVHDLLWMGINEKKMGGRSHPRIHLYD